MGLLSKIMRRRNDRQRGETAGASLWRRPRFETMEPRRMLDANPLFLGGVYIESDDGLDAKPDIFEVTFIGGAERTEMTDFTIKTNPIVFFDNTFRFANDPNNFVRVNENASIGIDASQVTFNLVNNRELQVFIDDFIAGDKLVFEIDVDHKVGSVVDRIASSAEFRLSTLEANFIDPLYEVNPAQAFPSPNLLSANDNDADPGNDPAGIEHHVYFDEYDTNFASAGLTGLLSADNDSDRHAGAMAEYVLSVNPVEISGNVHLSNEDGDCFGPGHPEHRPLEGAAVYLISDQGTVLRTTTDANGDYSFTSDDLPDGEFLFPGTYTIIEVTPDHLFDGGEHVGTVNGNPVGELPTVPPDEIQMADGSVLRISDIVAAGELDRLDFITAITLTHGEKGIRYDFCEDEPSSLSGHVFKDVNENDVRDSGDTALVGVEVILFDENGVQVGESAFTDANGFYRFDDLRAGTYSIFEIQPEDCFDGNVIAGTIDGDGDGVARRGFDEIVSIEIGPGQNGVNYDFLELTGSLRGNVHLSTVDGDCVGPGHPDHRPLEGVSVYLIHENGDVQHTLTDANGDYAFTNLRTGNYTIIEVTPENLLDGDESAGTINGFEVGDAESILEVNDLGGETEIVLESGQIIRIANFEDVRAAKIDAITNVFLEFDDRNGVNYDFCEHEPSSLSGHVFKDVNQNDVRDGGDTALAGVELFLLDANGQQVGQSVFTDANGFYRFDNLTAGVYSIVEVQPEDCFDGAVLAGTIDGSGDGIARQGFNETASIELGFGQNGVNYDFLELTGSLRGNVHLSSVNGECFEPGHPDHRPLEGVSVYLIHQNGDVQHTLTDANGDYAFTNLRTGNYTIIEVTPESLLDGDESAGTINGFEVGDAEPILEVNDLGGETEIVLGSGQVIRIANFEDVRGAKIDAITNIFLEFDDRNGVNFDFCEHEPSSLSGHVFEDINDNGIREVGERLLTGVQMLLLDSGGNQVGSTVTNAQGFYQFDNLYAGSYTVREVQPGDYFDGKDIAGTVGGATVGDVDRFPAADSVLVDDDVISAIDLGFGQHGINYDFGEVPPSSLSGFVYHDVNRNGVKDANEAGIGGIPMELRLTFNNGITGVLLTEHHVLDDAVLDSGERYVIVTDSRGFYRFSGIRGGAIETSGGVLLGNYAVYQNVQPPGFDDGLDRPGDTGGVADNSNHGVVSATNPFTLAILQTHSTSGARSGDLLYLIPVGIGQESQSNNFGEHKETPTIPPRTPDPEPPVNPPPPGIFIIPPQVALPPAPILPAPRAFLIDGAGGAPDYTWHLSVIDAGLPRGQGTADVTEDDVWFTASYLNHSNWMDSDLHQAVWSLLDDTGEPVLRNSVFGVLGGTPVVGDFNGDGIDEVGVFYNGEWFVDLNGNGRWDEHDFWAKLGDTEDRPITGDWDGDGKDDIGIYGPVWERDPIAIEHEPGLPDANNVPKELAKNVPPAEDVATNGHRVMRRTSEGSPRADLIDHVFRFGVPDDVPLAGDWNGDGITTIGVFRDGRWMLDMDGDGRWTAADVTAQFGQRGDTPVVGDFDGNGVDDIGVYSAGKWIIDINRNREMDAHDKVFEMGGADDTPVVGDWDGDGIDEPGLYRDAGTRGAVQARR